MPKETSHEETQDPDCSSAPMHMDWTQATSVLTAHAAHGPDCPRYLAALQTLSTVLG